MIDRAMFLSAFALFAGSAAIGDIGLARNPDDQLRFVWDCGDAVVPAFARMGFNAVVNEIPVGWDVVGNRAPSDFAARIADGRRRLDFYATNDIGFIQWFRYDHDRKASEAFARVGRDGAKVTVADRIDASDPRYIEAVRSAVKAQAEALARHPASIGALVATEMRGSVQPSFTSGMEAAWRAHAGCPVPAETNGRNPLPWSEIPYFPKDRVVPDGWPMLEFYRWQWRKGDGWADYLDMVAGVFMRAAGKPVITMYDPALRSLPQWGNLGSKLTHINHWTYVYPEPYCIGYNIAEQQAVARGQPGQKILTMIQAISYRSKLAPQTEHPPHEPEWAKEMPDCRYPTTPPDMVQEAMWHVFARKVDGIGFHGWNALFDDGRRRTARGYAQANPETVKRIERIFRDVAVPLGPLLRAVPERAPEVAVLESCAGQVLGGRISYGVHYFFADVMFIADAANLSPYVIYEDEIKATGIPASVKTLILPRCEALTRTSYDRIAAFQRAGGRIVADDLLAPALKADAVYSNVNEEIRNMKGDFDDGIVRPAEDAEVRDRSMWRAAAKLKAAAGVAPYADCDAFDVLVRARSYGSADYVFAINSKRALGPYVGAWRRVLERGMPNKGAVTVARAAGAVYDLVRNRAVPFVSEGGRTTIPVEFETNDGRCLMVVPKPLGELSFVCTSGRIDVRSPDRDVMIPIRVEGFGKPFYAVVKDGSWSRGFAAVPDARVRVVNLADGRAAAQLEASASAR